ncbi:uncharacterized protein [Dermacentor andersoni]|uniref:uncharacterized protein isoform X2 n=1 Tax=Dermacentor andersoni TaxID=34620 RepID=UPI0024160294|nr:fibrillin-1-like isoform X2 [Dermacentor andersoni]
MNSEAMKLNRVNLLCARSVVLLTLLLYGSEPGVSTEVMPPFQPYPMTPCSYGNKGNCSVEVKRGSVPRQGSQNSQNCRIAPLIGEGRVIILRERPDYVTYQCKFGYGNGKEYMVIACKDGKWAQPPPHCLDSKGLPAVHHISQPTTKNPCEDDVGGCDHYCCFDGKSAHCFCKRGYMVNGTRCIDIDECQTTQNTCKGQCVNTDGSFRCVCTDGYKLDKDGKSCKDIDECQTPQNPCEGQCLNTEGSFRCVCPAGYKLDKDGKSCKDINECAVYNGDCKLRCENTLGSFKCHCDIPGYTLATDGTSCLDIRARPRDYCAENNGGCSHTCHSGDSAAICSCPEGLQLSRNSKRCEDVDECIENKYGCAHRCVNLLGSAYCECHKGYRRQADGKSCEDIDECLDPEVRAECAHGCRNTNGSYVCRKEPDATTTKGHSFETADEVEESGCGDYGYHEIERDRTPSAACSSGFARVESGCIDIDECAEKTLNCSHDCINVAGSAFCSCPLGFKLMADNLTCVDSNECEGNPRICSQLCTNTHGSYKCSCKTGYTLSASDSFQCIDNDECTMGNHTCSHICVNIEGGYYCQCPKGYKITGDLKTCSAVTCPMFVEASNSVTTCDPPVVDSSAAIGTRCNVRCNAGFYLEGSNVTMCTMQGTWTHGPPTCEGLSCPALQHPENGKVLPERCLSPGANYLKSRCYFHCNPGFRLLGKRVNTCGVNRTSRSAKTLDWKHPAGTCKKDAGPVRITCPSSIRLVLPEGQSSMYLQLPEPDTNVEANNVQLFIDGFPNASEVVPYGDVQATYVATNPEDNSTAKCSFQVTVDDKEPPKVLRCPSTVTAISTTLEGVPVTWEEPEFSDNVDVQSVRSTQSPGSVFNFGLHNVYYTARDIAGNEAVCTFYVNVSRNECRLPADIEHGSTECENWLHGVVCEPSCEDGYALPGNVSFYTCDLAGVWEPRSWIPNCRAYTPTSAMGCPPGSEFFEELDGEANVCVECPAGMYWSQDVGQCFLCEPGFYQDRPGQSSCAPCPAAATPLSGAVGQQCSS